jgi:hypothetical protein
VPECLLGVNAGLARLAREAARRVSKPPLAFRGGNPCRRVEDEAALTVAVAGADGLVAFLLPEGPRNGGGRDAEVASELPDRWQARPGRRQPDRHSW